VNLGLALVAYGDWQNEQLAREREAERQAREAGCGLEGCPIPN
jgi:hypothetical protein